MLGFLIAVIVATYSKNFFMGIAHIFINQQLSSGKDAKKQVKTSRKNLFEVKKYFSEVDDL